MRTDKQVVEQTNELARQLYELRGYHVRQGYRFDKATLSFPRNFVFQEMGYNTPTDWKEKCS